MSQELTFSISEVAAMVGLSAHTIRVWERRYGLAGPRRSGAGHRRYGMEEVQLLRRMKQVADARGVTLRMAALEVQGELAASAAQAPVDDAEPAPEALRDDSPWRAAADLVPQPILLLDATGAIADANVAFARAGGFIREKLRGTRFSDLVDPYDRPKAAAIWQELSRPRRSWELNLRTPMGSGLFSFDCWPLLSRGHRLMVLIGRELGEAGMELWPTEGGSREEAGGG